MFCWFLIMCLYVGRRGLLLYWHSIKSVFFVSNCINVYYVTLVLLPIVVCHQCFSFRVTPQRNWIYHLHPSQATIREQCVQIGSVSLGLDKLRCVLFLLDCLDLFYLKCIGRSIVIKIQCCELSQLELRSLPVLQVHKNDTAWIHIKLNKVRIN